MVMDIASSSIHRLDMFLNALRKMNESIASEKNPNSLEAIRKQNDFTLITYFFRFQFDLLFRLLVLDRPDLIRRIFVLGLTEQELKALESDIAKELELAKAHNIFTTPFQETLDKMRAKAKEDTLTLENHAIPWKDAYEELQQQFEAQQMYRQLHAEYEVVAVAYYQERHQVFATYHLEMQPFIDALMEYVFEDSLTPEPETTVLPSPEEEARDAEKIENLQVKEGIPQSLADEARELIEEHGKLRRRLSQIVSASSQALHRLDEDVHRRYRRHRSTVIGILRNNPNAAVILNCTPNAEEAINKAEDNLARIDDHYGAQLKEMAAKLDELLREIINNTTYIDQLEKTFALLSQAEPSMKPILDDCIKAMRASYDLHRFFANSEEELSQLLSQSFAEILNKSLTDLKALNSNMPSTHLEEAIEVLSKQHKDMEAYNSSRPHEQIQDKTEASVLETVMPEQPKEVQPAVAEASEPAPEPKAHKGKRRRTPAQAPAPDSFKQRFLEATGEPDDANKAPKPEVGG